jgi:hypothetical protein
VFCGFSKTCFIKLKYSSSPMVLSRPIASLISQECLPCREDCSDYCNVHYVCNLSPCSSSLSHQGSQIPNSADGAVHVSKVREQSRIRKARVGHPPLQCIMVLPGICHR